MRLDNCLACGGSELATYAMLGKQALANSFTEEPEDNRKTYDLSVRVCGDCWHSQLLYAVPPEVLYKHYLYESGTAKSHIEHFKDLAKHASNLTISKIFKSSVLDIGCNNGTLLKEFERFDWFDTFQGVDPAENINCPYPVLRDFWDENTWYKLDDSYDIVCGLNVFAHNINPYGFLKGVKKVMPEWGSLILEFPLWTNSFRLPDIGQIYHEHYNYFTTSSFVSLLERVGNLKIEEVRHFPNMHGGTVRFVVRVSNDPHCLEVRHMMRAEADMREASSYGNFQGTINKQALDLADEVDRFKSEGYKVVAYGASAKSSVLLQFSKRLAGAVDYIVDDAPMKINTFSPAGNIPVKPTSELLKESDKTVVLCTAHNFFADIKERLHNMGFHGKILSYLPELKSEDV